MMYWASEALTLPETTEPLDSFIHTHTHTYIHTYIHTCMHAYIHTYQMMYWASEALNLPETTEPLDSFMLALRESGQNTAQCMYGAPGWVAHGYTDIWMNAGDVCVCVCVCVCVHAWRV